MDRRNLYRDYFSHGASYSEAPSNRGSIPTDDDMDVHSQVPGHSLSSGRVGMQNLDLNSQIDGFPFLDDYSGLLQEEGLPEACGSRGQGGTSTAFQPPQSHGGRGRSGRGRSFVTRGRGRAAGFVPPAAGRGHQLPRHRIGLSPLGVGEGIGGRGRGRGTVGRGFAPDWMDNYAEVGDNAEEGDVGEDDNIKDEDENGSSQVKSKLNVFFL